MSPNSPKRWNPPKAWRTRNKVQPLTSRSLAAFFEEFLQLIPGYTYRRIPDWARAAYARHWMTFEQMLDAREDYTVPPWPRYVWAEVFAEARKSAILKEPRT